MSPGSRSARITLLGDSISAGYGLPAAEALPVRLEAELARLGHSCRITGAGVDGDTTAHALVRLDRDVPPGTDLCVIALGANDLMQARDPAHIERDLDAIAARLVARGIAPMICGMRAPPWLSDYAPRFDAVFPAVAARHHMALYPFLLEGVALNPALNLSDRIHPNAAGIALIARGLAPSVVKALEAAECRTS